jgi:diacylglycerol kinase family enzyme
MKVNLEQKPKTYVVINPVAGLSQLEIVRERVQSALQEREIPFEIYETTGEEDIRQMVRDKIQQGFKLFIAAGGDGTLSAVVDGLAGTQIPFVIVPTGTWNALARALDIPLQLEAAIDLLFQEHQVRAIDAIQVDKRFFVLSVSAGIGSRTMKDAERHETKFRASELLVTNSAILGLKAVQLDPNIRMDDGKLNVCRIYAKTVGDYLRVGVSMLTGSQKRNWNMSCVEVSDEVEIRCKQKLPVQGDGDMIGYLPITAKVRPKAIHIVTPVDAQT